MKDYIFNKVKESVRHLVVSAAIQKEISHKPLKGRIRELLVNELINPWIPEYTKCGTGIIIDAQEPPIISGQEDLVIFDKTFSPRVFFMNDSQESVFPLNCVISRIEVKSCVTVDSIIQVISSTKKIYNMLFSGPSGPEIMYPPTLIFGYGCKIKKGAEMELIFNKLKDLDALIIPEKRVIDGIIDGVCIVGRGFWCRTSEGWKFVKPDSDYSEVIAFVSLISNSCYAIHNVRMSVKSDWVNGIGGYLGNRIQYVSIDSKVQGILNSIS